MNNSTKPFISICLISFNHEKYIAESLKSVINQTLKDFEVIVVNDGSIDQTEAIIQSFDDHRIKYIAQKNQGPSMALNTGIQNASGEYVAFLSGDDVWHPKKLQKQCDYLLNTSDQDIVFSRVEFIDEDSSSLEVPWAETVFNQTTLKSRAEFLRTWFFKGNCLNAGTCIVKKKFLYDAGLFNLASIQLQDFDMWIKLVKKHEIHILPDKLLKYRIRTADMNLSSTKNDTRTHFEWYVIAKHIFDDMPMDLFKKAFFDQLKKPHFSTDIEYELEKAFLFLHHDILMLRSIGIEKLFNLLQIEPILTVSRQEYHFDLLDLYQLTAVNDLSNRIQLKHYQTVNELHEKTLNQIYQSTSWRITQYIRSLRKLYPKKIS